MNSRTLVCKNLGFRSKSTLNFYNDQYFLNILVRLIKSFCRFFKSIFTRFFNKSLPYLLLNKTNMKCFVNKIILISNGNFLLLNGTFFINSTQSYFNFQQMCIDDLKKQMDLTLDSHFQILRSTQTRLAELNNTVHNMLQVNHLVGLDRPKIYSFVLIRPTLEIFEF